MAQNNAIQRVTSPVEDTTQQQEQEHEQDTTHLVVPKSPIVPTPRRIASAPKTTTPHMATPRVTSVPTPRVTAVPTPRMTPIPTPRISTITPRTFVIAPHHHPSTTPHHTPHHRAPDTSSHFPYIDVHNTEIKPTSVTRVDSFPLESPIQITNRPLLHVSIPTSVIEPYTGAATTTSTAASTLPPRPTPSSRVQARLIPIDIKAPPSTSASTPLMSPAYRTATTTTTNNNGYRSPYVAVETERDVQGLQVTYVYNHECETGE